MQAGLSVYLDLLRWVAAMMVFSGHLVGHPYFHGLPEWDAGLQDDGVIIFFVLSGLVIAFVTETRADERFLAPYLIARLARLWSVALPALLLTTLFDAIGQATRPEAYWFSALDPTSLTVNLLMSILFANQFYLFDAGFQPGSNLPYWSLSYEFIYYLLFGLAVLRRKTIRWLWVALFAYLAGHRIMLLLPIWVFGVLVWNYRGQVASRWLGGLFLIVPIGIYAAMRLAQWDVALGQWGDRMLLSGIPLDWSRMLLWKYLLGVIVAIHLLGAAILADRWRFGGCVPLIRWLGSTTFTIYLLHFPLLNMLNALLPAPASGGGRVLLLAACSLPVMCAMSWVLEKQRAPLRRALQSGWNRLSGAGS